MRYSKKDSWLLGIIGGLFGWLAIISGAVLVIGLISAIFFNKSWWIPVAGLAGFIFFKEVMRTYHSEWKNSGSVENYSDVKQNK